jgi:hypothetical protein
LFNAKWAVCQLYYGEKGLPFDKRCYLTFCTFSFVSWRVVVQFVHATGKTWYKVLYKHTMYVISLSNISVKTNFKEITRVEIRLTNLYNTMRETTFCAWHLFVAVHSIALLTLLTLTCFTPYSRSCLLREQIAPQLVMIATCSDTCSHNRLDLIQSLVPPHYICNGYTFLLY